MEQNEFGPSKLESNGHELIEREIRPILKRIGGIKKEHDKFSTKRNAMKEVERYLFDILLKKIKNEETPNNIIVHTVDTNSNDIELSKIKFIYSQNKFRKWVKEIIPTINRYDAVKNYGLSLYAVKLFKLGENNAEEEKEEDLEKIVKEAESWYYETFGVKPDPEIIKTPEDMAKAQNDPKAHWELLKVFAIDKKNKAEKLGERKEKLGEWGPSETRYFAARKPWWQD